MIHHTAQRFSFSLELRHLLLVLLVSLAATALSSCISIQSLFGSKLHMAVTVDTMANDNIPVAMAVVYVYDEDAMNRLLGLSARQWFDTRTQIEASYHEYNPFEVYDYEWIPGQDTAIALPYRATSVGAIIFANYFNDGLHRVQIDPYTDIVVNFQDRDLAIEPAP